VLDDLNCRDVLDDRVDQVGLDDRQHLLDAVVYCPLQKVSPDGQFFRLDLGEGDAQNQGFRRVAWHSDAIAKTTNKD